MEKKTGQYIKHIEKLNEYISDLRRRNEEEINIRKQFEAKLNELHSVGRDQDTKYFRALEEIDDYMQKLVSDIQERYIEKLG
jgi:predicted RNase H-like nuclease (RuvC/YqgF family)